MKLQLPQIVKQYVLQFADLYHKYKIETEKLQRVKYSIHSSLTYYKKTGMIQLSYNDMPGDLLPPMSIREIKNTSDILAGLHPIDVNSINDLFYLSQDKISKIIVNENKIQVFNQSGQYVEHDINEVFDHENSASKRISFLIGYMQAEKLMRDAYSVKEEKYKIIKDNITTLQILDITTHIEFLKSPTDILFSNEYKYFSKEDISRIGYICGQMSKL
ncbi:MAG: hypothetical protein WC785_09430 [Tatlockia sp.]|jgi:hypothetical protein